MRLPDGLTIELVNNKRTGELVYCVEYTEEYITRLVLSTLEEIIKRVEIALKVCKHTKRKHRLMKHYSALIKFHKENQEKLNSLINDDLPTRFTGFT